MAILFEKLRQRGIERMGKQPVQQGLQPQIQPPSPLPSITEQITAPPARMPTMPLSGRMATASVRGELGSMPQWQSINKRFIADLPANVQLKGIADILAGQDSNSPIINNFVRGMAAQGKSPEDIRQAFIAQQKPSQNPLVLM
mgnify:CR=1 FL=1